MAKYYWLMLCMAFKHSLGVAQTVVFILLILLGAVAHWVPGVKTMIDVSGSLVAATILGLIIVIRLILAPFWIWKNDQKEILALKVLKEDFSDEMRSNVHAKLAQLPSEVRRALYRVATAEIAADQLNVEMKTELERAGFIEPAFAYTPAKFIEQNRPFIAQWFKQNPL
jgi:hypothetical protein